jgi:hypothetical protein
MVSLLRLSSTFVNQTIAAMTEDGIVNLLVPLLLHGAEVG